MNIEDLSSKHINDLERLIRETLEVMRQAKLSNEPLAKSLYQFGQELADTRCKRFDAANPEYHSY